MAFDTQQLRRIGNSLHALATLADNETIPRGSLSIGLEGLVEELHEMQLDLQQKALEELDYRGE
jgi:hypothetical protein